MKAYIVEDYEPMRMILKRVLKKNFPMIKSVGESETAEDAIIKITEFKPDIALIDISLPGMDGIELIRTIKPQCKAICILVVTAHEVELYKDKALKAGAHEIASKADFSGLIKVISDLLERKKTGGCD
ncbi:MAG TPA: response regulator transcription factor [Chitinispirillaceae bacterium]|nr:response regulator transcription factor [Chitinispirillaceae bacterium]